MFMLKQRSFQSILRLLELSLDVVRNLQKGKACESHVFPPLSITRWILLLRLIPSSFGAHGKPAKFGVRRKSQWIMERIRRPGKRGRRFRNK
jgi:hypothetical protein